MEKAKMQMLEDEELSDVSGGLIIERTLIGMPEEEALKIADRLREGDETLRWSKMSADEFILLWRENNHYKLVSL